MGSFRTIHLHGALRRFGRCFTFAAATPAECVRALIFQLPGFREELEAGQFRVVTGPRGSRHERGDEELHAGFSQVMHLVPVVAGANGKGAAIGAIVGGALLVAAAFVPVLAIGGSFAAATVFGVSSSTVALMGAGAILYGTSALLAPKPKLDGGQVAQGEKATDSFIFGGSPDRPVAGRPVQVGFGTFRVPCAVVSLQLKNVRIA